MVDTPYEHCTVLTTRRRIRGKSQLAPGVGPPRTTEAISVGTPPDTRDEAGVLTTLGQSKHDLSPPERLCAQQTVVVIFCRNPSYFLQSRYGLSTV